MVDVVKFRSSTNQLPRRDALVIEVGREALAGRAVSLTTFTQALREFGPKGLVDVVSVIAEYAGTAVVLNAFDQQLRPGQKPLLPRRSDPK